MILPTKTRVALAAAAASLCASTLLACAAGATPERARDPAPLRVMVQLVRGSDDGNAISSEAMRIAGVRVTYAAATSAAWHALALHCASDAECDAALARMRAAKGTYKTVEIEGRKSRAAS